MITKIKKRDGRKVNFDENKILNVLQKVLNSTHPDDTLSSDELAMAKTLTRDVINRVQDQFLDKIPEVDDIQNIVEKVLISGGFAHEAQNFIEYRQKRTAEREYNNDLTKTYRKMLTSKAQDMDLMRENANIDGNSVMGTMLRIGSEANKNFIDKYILKPEYSFAHSNGDFHIHDKDFYELTFNCLQVDTNKLLKNGYSTGHGYIRSPQSIQSASALMCIAIQSEQNDQFGGVGVATFEYDLAPFVAKTYAKNIAKILDLFVSTDSSISDNIKNSLEEIYEKYNTVLSPDAQKEVAKVVYYYTSCLPEYDFKTKLVLDKAKEYTEKETFQAMEALVHNLNSMHSRAGSQTPFSSINYGTGTTEECRMVIRNVLLATEKGMGNGETPIFPVQIFRVKKGINFEKGEPNYDLFELACRVSAKRLFPNFEYQDTPYNIQYYKEGRPETELAVMGCRTRVYGNVNGDSICPGRGNFSFTTINLPRLGIESKGDWDKFFTKLDYMMDLAKEQLETRYDIIAHKHVYNFPFAFGQKIYYGSENLKPNDEIAEALKNSSLSIGFIGLAECMVAMTGHHHGEGKQYYDQAYKIIQHMRERTDRYTEETHMNWSTFATPAEGLSSRFTRIDKKKYGVIPGVTDREYYTNSFHIPVYFDITAGKKMELEGPFHELCNAGAITYVEANGDFTKNLEAFEDLVKYGLKCGLNYFAINHPVDSCPVCGYTGIIDDECPCCGFKDGTTEMDYDKLRELQRRGMLKNINLVENCHACSE